MSNWDARVDEDSPMVRRTRAGRVSEAGRKADDTIAALAADGKRRRIDVPDLTTARRIKAQLKRAADRAGLAVSVSMRDDGNGGHIVWLRKAEGEGDRS